MGCKTILAIGLILLVGFCPLVAAEPIAVVTAANSPPHKLSFDSLKLIYLRKVQVDEHGNRWIPINLPATHPLRYEFSSTLFSLLPEDQEDYWNGQYFHGIMPPSVLSSEEAVLRFVSSTPGGIGYVQKSHADGRVKIILTLPAATNR
jgi:hypothetical protein